MQDEPTVNIYPLLTWSRSFIDAMVERGAVKGSEIVEIASVRQQLSVVIEAIEKQTANIDVELNSSEDSE